MDTDFNLCFRKAKPTLSVINSGDPALYMENFTLSWDSCTPLFSKLGNFTLQPADRNAKRKYLQAAVQDHLCSELDTRCQTSPFPGAPDNLCTAGDPGGPGTRASGAQAATTRDAQSSLFRRALRAPRAERDQSLLPVTGDKAHLTRARQRAGLESLDAFHSTNLKSS